MGVLVVATVTGCSWVGGFGDRSTGAGAFGEEEATAGEFEEMSGAVIPDSAENVRVIGYENERGLPGFAAAFTLPSASEEDAEAFCASGDIGNYGARFDGVDDDERAEYPLLEGEELQNPRHCSSMASGTTVSRSVLFSIPDDGPVQVWARAEDYGR